MTAVENHSPLEVSQRSILKTSDSAVLAEAGETAEPTEAAMKRQQSAGAAVRVEICEHRNKLIFYRQDMGWRVGYFAEHRHRHARRQHQDQQQSKHLSQHKQQQPVPIASGRRVTYPIAGDGPSTPPPVSLSERSSPDGRPASQPRSMSASDLEISTRVIHACTNGCFAINS